MKLTPIAPLSLNDVARFWSMVDVKSADECWLWTGPRFAKGTVKGKRNLTGGYGRFYVAREGKTLSLRTNRVALFLKTGTDTGELQACLTCARRLCCNGDHLFWATDQGRMDHCVAKHRQATGDRAASRLYPGIRQGENSGKAKLIDAQVRDILELAAPSIAAGSTLPGRRFPKGLTGGIIARLHLPVSKSEVQRIMRRQNWSHIQ